MVKTTKDRKVKDPIRNVPLKLEVIDEGADHTDNVKKNMSCAEYLQKDTR